MSQIKPETKRKRIKDDIESKMKNRGVTSDLYQSKLEEYMELYDHGRSLQDTAELLASNPETVKTYIECIKEIRQIRKSMTDILNWLGVDPTKESAEGDGYDL